MLMSDNGIRSAVHIGWISIDPFDEHMVQPSSIDVRLGNHFVMYRPEWVLPGQVIDPETRAVTVGIDTGQQANTDVRRQTVESASAIEMRRAAGGCAVTHRGSASAGLAERHVVALDAGGREIEP